jgi:hypothetical protein
MKRIISAGCIALAIAGGIAPPSTTVAAERLSPEEIIQREGHFVFTDGTSFFYFRKDNTFESGPVIGISGQTISGRWRHPGSSGDWVIEGQWGWINGINVRDDFRRMVMRVSSAEPTGETIPASFRFLMPTSASTEPARLYKAYFTIQELAKIAPPAGMASSTRGERLPVRSQVLSATASGVLDMAEWRIENDREFVVRLGFAPAPAGAPEPRPVTQVWLLRADGTAIPQAKPPDEVRSTGRIPRNRIYQYPLSARDEAVSVVVRVGDDYFADRVLR